MPTNFEGLDGRQIITATQKELHRLASEMRVLLAMDEVSVEHRSRRRRENTAAVRGVREQAKAALAAWAKAEAAEARKRLAANDLGTPAEEMRRNTVELRIGRLVEQARARGEERALAGDYARRADQAYSLGNLDEAETYARASQELGQEPLAREVLALVAYDRTAEDPAKARALQSLGDIDVVTAAFHRDVSGAYSAALQASGALGQTLGETATEEVSEAASASIEAKMAAAITSMHNGTPYKAPDGAVHSEPLSISRPGHVPQPDGARLSGMTVDKD